jgi:hypothetical protein
MPKRFCPCPQPATALVKLPGQRPVTIPYRTLIDHTQSSTYTQPTPPTLFLDAS